MKINRALLIPVLMMWTLAGCRTGPSHPPTFSDYKRAVQKDASHETLDSQVEVFEAADLSVKELKNFLTTQRSTEELIGAGSQGKIFEPLGRELLQRATRQSPEDPVAWAALAYRDFSLLGNGTEQSGTISDEIGPAIRRWRLLEPTNAAPCYLEAEFECLRTNLASAKRFLEEAHSKERFESYTTAIQKCVIRASESAGRSRFIARMCAMGHIVAIVNWSKLSKTILAENPPDQHAVQSCFTLGARVGRGKSFLEQVVGDSIKTKALDKMPGQNHSDERTKISQRRAYIKRAIAYNTSLERRPITEERSVRFLDECFDKGEKEALESLAAENRETF